MTAKQLMAIWTLLLCIVIASPNLNSPLVLISAFISAGWLIAAAKEKR